MRYRSGLFSIPLVTVLFLAACARRPNDDVIATAVKARFFSDPAVKLADVTVSVKNGEVTLTGSVPGVDVQFKAFKLAYETPGVTAIHDRIAIVPPPAPVTPAAAPAVAKPPREVARTEPPPSPEPAEAPPAQPEAPPPPAPTMVAVQMNAPPTRVIVTPRREIVQQPAEPPPPAPDVTAIAVGVPGRGDSLTTSPSLRGITITIGGAITSPVYRQWFEQYHKERPDVSVNLAGRTFTSAIQMLADWRIDLGASAVPVPEAGTETRLLGNKPLEVPMFMSAVSPVYNIPGIGGTVNFTPDVLAGIFLGKITRWNDPALVAVNSKLQLPGAFITVINQETSLPVSLCFTDYLARQSQFWQSSVNAKAKFSWPLGSFSHGDLEVAKLVHSTPNSIGYVDMAFVAENGLASGAVSNLRGRFVQATPANVTAAPPDNSSANAYPMWSFDWMIVPGYGSDYTKRRAILDLLQWALTKGQTMVGQFGGAPLPGPVAQDALRQVRALP